MAFRSISSASSNRSISSASTNRTIATGESYRSIAAVTATVGFPYTFTFTFSSPTGESMRVLRAYTSFRTVV